MVGLQFHLDYSAASIEQMLRHCAAELDDGPSVQNPEEMLGHPDRVEDGGRLLFPLLDAMSER